MKSVWKWVSGAISFWMSQTALTAHAQAPEIVVYNPTDEPQPVEATVWSDPEPVHGLSWIDPSIRPSDDAPEGSAWFFTGEVPVEGWDLHEKMDTAWVKTIHDVAPFPEGWVQFASIGTTDDLFPDPPVVTCEYCDTSAERPRDGKCRSCGAPLPLS